MPGSRPARATHGRDPQGSPDCAPAGSRSEPRRERALPPARVRTTMRRSVEEAHSSPLRGNLTRDESNSRTTEQERTCKPDCGSVYRVLR